MTCFEPRQLSLAVAAAMIGAVSHAADVQVLNTADSGTGSLREAVADANDGDRIVLDPDTMGGSTISLVSGHIDVGLKKLHFYAAPTSDGDPTVTIEAATSNRVFYASSADMLIIQGLTLSGGNPSSVGGAIFTRDMDLVIANSTISGNTAMGAGGGVAALNSNVCVSASEISGNTVNAFDYYSEGAFASASGGGLTVSGSLSLLGEAKYVDEEDVCSTENFPDFAVVGPGETPLLITNNVARTNDSNFTDAKYLEALGGGVALTPAVVGDSFIDCPNLPFGSNNPSFCSAGAQITNNTAEVLLGVSVDLNSPRFVNSIGGGVFISPRVEATEDALAATVYGSVISGNAAIVGDNGEDGNIQISENVLFASGGGIGIKAINNDGDPIDSVLSPFLRDASEPSLEPSGDIEFLMVSSIVSGNAVSVEPSAKVGKTTRLVSAAGGGVSVDLLTNQYGDAVAFNLFTLVSDNTVETAATLTGAALTGDEPVLEVWAGGGGFNALDLPTYLLGEDTAESFKYFSVFGSNIDNAVVVAAHEESRVFGGGIAAPLVLSKYSKPVLEVNPDYSDDLGEGLALESFITIASAETGVSGNSISINAADGGDHSAYGGGVFAGTLSGSFSTGGLSGGLYSAVTLVAENEISIAGPGTNARVAAGGGGLASFSDLTGQKYDHVDSNSISISAPGATGTAAGGGLLSRTDLQFMTSSTVSRNHISAATGTDVDMGGGGFLVSSGFSADRYAGSVSNSTIASNTLTQNGAGDSLGSGAVFSSGDDVSVIHTSIVSNTDVGGSSGGQLVITGVNGDIELKHSLISGVSTPGTDGCLAFDNVTAPTIENLSVSNANSSDACVADLPASYADPSTLGPLQFNGALIDGAWPFDSGKYFNLPTIALLAGSGAVDAAVGSDSFAVDQRGFPRANTPDLGAFEYESSGDLDGEEELDIVGWGTLAGAESNSTFRVNVPNGDGNSDGVPDVNQPFVTTFATSLGGPNTYMTLVSESDTPEQIISVEPIGTASVIFNEYYASLDATELTPNNEAPLGFTAPLGGLSFTAENGGDFSLYVPTSLGITQLAKQECNAIGDDGPKWVILDDSPEVIDGSRLRFSFTIEDNGRFDCDPADNLIDDPIFPLGSPALPTSIPTTSTYFQLLSVGMIGLFGLLGLRRRGNRL